LLRKIITGAELLMFLKRSRRIRIIYIPERIQLHTICCCLPCLPDRSGLRQDSTIGLFINGLGFHTGFLSGLIHETQQKLRLTDRHLAANRSA
jgi:hypothetical protein